MMSKLFCGKLEGLFLLPEDKVQDGMVYRRHTPDGMEDLIDYFDSEYISRSFRHVQ